MQSQPTNGSDASHVSRRELRQLKWLTALVPGTIVLIYESARREALEHVFPGLPSLYADIIIFGLVLLVTCAFATFVFRIVERLQAQAVARSRDVATMSAVLEERARLSRELHDGFAQLVAYLLVRIDTVTGLATARRIPEALDELERMRSSADDLYQDVRESITELRTQVAEQGLALTLREYVDEYEERHDIRVALRGEEATGRLAPVSAYQLLRIVQEALANVRKHARAHEAWITFETPDPRTLQVEIGDDGSASIQRRGSLRNNRRLAWPACASAPKRSADASRSRAAPAVERKSESTCPSRNQAMPEQRWRLLLVDDHALFREGLAGLFSYEADFEVVGQAGDGPSNCAQTWS